MSTNLAKDLRPASFRGVPFQVDGADMGAGRRVQVHEYPQRDKPYVEDLGRATRDISLEAFVVGADYVAQATRLVAALEEAGPGALVHPWLGTLTVSIKDLARVQFNNALGYARISLAFVESGELAFPTANSATSAQSRIATSALEGAAVADFAAAFSVDGVQDFVVADAVAAINAAIALVGSGKVPGLELLGYAYNAATAAEGMLSLLGAPSSLGQAIANFLGVSNIIATAQRWAAIGNALVRAAGQDDLQPPVAPQVYTPSRQQSYTNTTATNALVRQLLLAQAVGASSLTATTVVDDAVALRNGLTAALDRESLTASDTSYTALQDARGKVWADLTTRAKDGARLTTRTPPETTPAVVLAYDIYEDADRDQELVQRNGVRHPGFVPPVPLKVLTR